MAIGALVDVLNKWNEMGVFSYVLPFLLVFAVVYGILSKIKIFEGNNAVNGIIALAAGLLSLQLDFVSTFFQQIFPKFGMALAVLLVVVICLGFFLKNDAWDDYKWMGTFVGVAVILWAVSTWNWSGDSSSVGFWLEENFWAIVIGIVLVVLVYFMTKKPEEEKKKT
jgi:hypothetical protein